MTLSKDELITNIERIINEKGYAGIDLVYLNKTTYYSIFDLLKELTIQYNKLKDRLGRFEWIKFLKERIETTSNEEETISLIKELDIQDINDSDKSYLQKYFNFPMFNEQAYKKNRQYRENYDQLLLELSESLNDNGIEDLAFKLLGMDFEEFNQKVESLNITISTITELLKTLSEKKGHYEVLMKGQLKDVCVICKRQAEKQEIKHIQQAKIEKREELKSKANTLHAKGLQFIYGVDSFLNSDDYPCLKELFDLQKASLSDPAWLKVKSNNKDQLIFEVKEGDYTLEELNEIRDFLKGLEVITALAKAKQRFSLHPKARGTLIHL